MLKSLNFDLFSFFFVLQTFCKISESMTNSIYTQNKLNFIDDNEFGKEMIVQSLVRNSLVMTLKRRVAIWYQEEFVRQWSM